MEAILAVDINNGLSKNSLIPWKSKKDINFFFNKTKNNVVIMGKNTYFSLPEENRPLKNRLNIVLTNNPNSFLLDDTISKYNNVIFTNDDEIYTSILIDREKYLLSYPSLNRDFKIYIIGGKQIYDKYISLCEKVWITQIKKDYSCDLVFEFKYKKQFKEEIYDEDSELKILKYEKI